VLPSDGNIVSPVEGRVVSVAASKHAVGIRATDGTELFVHVGLDTVSLRGEGFRLHGGVEDPVRIDRKGAV
jgi:PTS system glucose-specific IIA component